MQTQNLLSQLSSASPAPARQNAPPQPENSGLQFSQALSREMTQREMTQRAPVPQTQGPVQAKPAAQPKPAEKAQAAKQEAGKPAQAEPARQASASTEANDSKEAGGVSDGKAAPAAPEEQALSQSAAEAAARATELPVTDMLALVASFNQLQAAVPKEAAQAAALQAGGAAPVVADGLQPGVPDMAGQLLQGAELALGEQQQQPAAAKGHDRLAQAAPDAGAGALAGTELPSDLTAEPSKFANVLMRERAEPAQLKESLAAAAPLAGPAAQASLNIAQAATGAATDKIAARVGTPAWDNQISQKVVWMVAGKDQSATLTLNPPDLGPVQVVLNVTNDHASVAFSSAQLEVRQALENAMPKLREMLGESGIALGNATVDAGTHDQRQAQGERQAGGTNNGGRFAGNGNGGAEAEARPAGRPVASGSLPGTVDIFA